MGGLTFYHSFIYDRIPYIISRRLYGFQPSPQAFSYPLYGVQIAEGSTTVTAAVGSGGALIDTVGPLHPHEYGPLFPQAWIFEGLVGYGQDGVSFLIFFLCYYFK